MGSNARPLVLTGSSWHASSDGNWSTISLGAGIPEQSFTIIPSTSAQFVLVPIPDGCLPDSDPSNCGERRGVSQANGSSSGFDSSSSTSWNPYGIFELFVASNLVGSDAPNNALFGLDTVSITTGQNSSSEQLSISDSLVGGIATKDFYLGMMGLNPQSVNLSSVPEPQISFLSSLKEQGNISSLSFGYAAGAAYRDDPSHLVLGGYDQERQTEDVLQVPFESSMEVELQALLATDSFSGPVSVLQDRIVSVIDSTLPYIWLPNSTCDSLEVAFGLSFDDEKDLYLINDTIHSQIQEIAPKFTFRLGSPAGGGEIRIELPYEALVLEADWPFYNDSTRYFAIKRSQEEQYTLGRALLQDAYLVTDFERRTIKLSQANIVPSGTQSIKAISPYTPPANQDSSLTNNQEEGGKINVGLVAGVTIGGIVVLALIGVFLRWRWLKRRPKPADTRPSSTAKPPLSSRDSIAKLRAEAPGDIGRNELEGDMDKPLPELHGKDERFELQSPYAGNETKGERHELYSPHAGNTVTVESHELYSPDTPQGANQVNAIHGVFELSGLEAHSSKMKSPRP